LILRLVFHCFYYLSFYVYTYYVYLL